MKILFLYGKIQTNTIELKQDIKQNLTYYESNISQFINTMIFFSKIREILKSITSHIFNHFFHLIQRVQGNIGKKT